jgi:hypothetical protein
MRRDDRYTILVTGGSVAAQFAQPFGGHGPYLERLLNERYESPTGKPFLILNGGDGSWKQPQQLILFQLYLGSIDAVVTLDGYNEMRRFGENVRLEYPGTNFHLINPLATKTYADIVGRWVLGRLEGLATGSAILSRSQAAYAFIASLDTLLQRRAAGRGTPVTTLESLFALPSEWSEEQRAEWSMNQYISYVRMMNAIASEYAVPIAHFIQPVPKIGKPLSSDERDVVGSLDYADRYEWLANNLLGLRRRNIKVFSLLDVFKEHGETLYADEVHLVRHQDGSSRGYLLMSERMVDDLANAWGLTRRRP